MKLLSSMQEFDDFLFDIIRKSEKTLKIVSPFVDFEDRRKNQYWNDLIYLLKEKENILEIYTQPNTKYNKNKSVDLIRKSITQDESKIMTIHNLHAKMYINDDTALLSSMNLSYYSRKHSLDFGVITENEKDYNDVINYCNKYTSIYNKINQEPIKKHIIEYFSSKNIQAEFSSNDDNNNALWLTKNGNSILKCHSIGRLNDGDVDVHIRPERKNAKDASEYFSNTLSKRHNVKMEWDRRGKFYYFTQKCNFPVVGIIPVINISENRIMDILVDIFDYMTSGEG
jgi:hypothetical protein